MDLSNGLVGRTYLVTKLKTTNKLIFLSRGIYPGTIINIKQKIAYNHIIIIETDEIKLAMRGQLARLIEVNLCSY